LTCQNNYVETRC